jgi:hypothetical protein
MYFRDTALSSYTWVQVVTEQGSFIVTPGRLGYAIELYGPDTGWSAVRASVWEGLLQTFMPGG